MLLSIMDNFPKLNTKVYGEQECLPAYFLGLYLGLFASVTSSLWASLFKQLMQ